MLRIQHSQMPVVKLAARFRFQTYLTVITVDYGITQHFMKKRKGKTKQNKTKLLQGWGPYHPN